MWALLSFNTHRYIMGTDGVEKFVSTPELQSDNSIGGDPLEPGQVWAISPGGGEENPGLYRIVRSMKAQAPV